MKSGGKDQKVENKNIKPFLDALLEGLHLDGKPVRLGSLDSNGIREGLCKTPEQLLITFLKKYADVGKFFSSPLKKHKSLCTNVLAFMEAKAAEQTAKPDSKVAVDVKIANDAKKFFPAKSLFVEALEQISKYKSLPDIEPSGDLAALLGVLLAAFPEHKNIFHEDVLKRLPRVDIFKEYFSVAFTFIIDCLKENPAQPLSFYNFTSLLTVFNDQKIRERLYKELIPKLLNSDARNNVIKLLNTLCEQASAQEKEKYIIPFFMTAMPPELSRVCFGTTKRGYSKAILDAMSPAQQDMYSVVTEQDKVPLAKADAKVELLDQQKLGLEIVELKAAIKTTREVYKHAVYETLAGMLMLQYQYYSDEQREDIIKFFLSALDEPWCGKAMSALNMLDGANFSIIPERIILEKLFKMYDEKKLPLSANKLPELLGNLSRLVKDDSEKEKILEMFSAIRQEKDGDYNPVLGGFSLIPWITPEMKRDILMPLLRFELRVDSAKTIDAVLAIAQRLTSEEERIVLMRELHIMAANASLMQDGVTGDKRFIHALCQIYKMDLAVPEQRLAKEVGNAVECLTMDILSIIAKKV